MKWLFTLLAVLNIAVFGGTVGYKLAVKATGGVPENRAVENTPPATPAADNAAASVEDTAAL
ncbi:hypothetical protein LAZ26_10175, partial [Haemophilus influenzae]|nr:hypothetical protein [Haemophilus influenzae]